MMVRPLQIAQRSQWRAYMETTVALSNCAIADPYELPFFQNGGSICPKIREYGHISATATGDPIHFMFGSLGFSRSADRMALFSVTSTPIKLAAVRHLG